MKNIFAIIDELMQLKTNFTLIESKYKKLNTQYEQVKQSELELRSQIDKLNTYITDLVTQDFVNKPQYYQWHNNYTKTIIQNDNKQS